MTVVIHYTTNNQTTTGIVLMPSHLKAVIRIRGIGSATAVAAELSVDYIAVADTVKQGVLNVCLVSWLTISLEHLDDVISVVS